MIDNWLLAPVLIVIPLLVAWEVLRGIRYQKQMRQQDNAMRRLQSDLHALCAGSISMGKHISALEQRLHRMTERQDQLELRDPVQQAYAHAIRLAQQGADVGDLMDRCGLSQGEAELLLRVHRVQRRQAASA